MISLRTLGNRALYFSKSLILRMKVVEARGVETGENNFTGPMEISNPRRI